MTWGPLTHLQLCDDAVLIILVLDGRGHDWGRGGRAGHLGHSPAQLHLGLLHLQLLGLGLLQGPGLIRPGSVCLQPAHLLGPIPSRPYPTCPPSSALSAWPLPMEEAQASSRVATSQPPFFPLPLREGATPEGLQRSSQASLPLNPTYLSPSQGRGWYLDEGRILLAGDHDLSSACGGQAMGGGEAPAGRGRWWGLGGLLCAVSGHCQLICGQPRGWGQPWSLCTTSDSKVRVNLASSSREEERGNLRERTQAPSSSPASLCNPAPSPVTLPLTALIPSTQSLVQGTTALAAPGACWKCRSSGPTPSC